LDLNIHPPIGFRKVLGQKPETVILPGISIERKKKERKEKEKVSFP